MSCFYLQSGLGEAGNIEAGSSRYVLWLYWLSFLLSSCVVINKKFRVRTTLGSLRSEGSRTGSCPLPTCQANCRHEKLPPDASMAVIGHARLAPVGSPTAPWQQKRLPLGSYRRWRRLTRARPMLGGGTTACLRHGLGGLVESCSVVTWSGRVCLRKWEGEKC